MKIKGVELEWYVLRWNSNKKRMEPYNILYNIKDTLVKEIRNKHIYNKSILKEYLRTEFIYQYWSKAEWEFYASDLNGMNYDKVDIWQQIEPNLDNIVEYVNEKMKLKF